MQTLPKLKVDVTREALNAVERVLAAVLDAGTDHNVGRSDEVLRRSMVWLSR